MTAHSIHDLWVHWKFARELFLASVAGSWAPTQELAD